MTRLIRLLNSRFAVLIALLPGINILSLVLRLICVKSSASAVSLWHICMIGIPFVVLYNVLPGHLGWIVTHFLISAIAVYFTVKVKVKNTSNIMLDKKASIGLLITLVFVIFVVVLKPMISESNSDIRSVNAALHAIANDDDETWSGLIHPSCSVELDLSEVKKQLQTDGINLEEGYYSDSKQIYTSYAYSVSDGKARGLETFIYSNATDEEYKVNAVWQDNSSGSGYIEFNIKKR